MSNMNAIGVIPLRLSLFLRTLDVTGRVAAFSLVDCIAN